MKTKHTESPWKIGKAIDGYAQINGKGWAGLANVVVCLDLSDNGGSENAPNEEGQANARLIAAAPDLLAALELLLSSVNEFTNDARLAIPRGVARAAIDRATTNPTP